MSDDIHITPERYRAMYEAERAGEALAKKFFAKCEAETKAKAATVFTSPVIQVVTPVEETLEPPVPFYEPETQAGTSVLQPPDSPSEPPKLANLAGAAYQIASDPEKPVFKPFYEVVPDAALDQVTPLNARRPLVGGGRVSHLRALADKILNMSARASLIDFDDPA